MTDLELLGPSRGWRIAAACLLLAAVVVVGGLGLSDWWLVAAMAFFATSRTAVEVTRVLRERRDAARLAREEPVDVWIVEIDGEDIGLLVQPVVTDMFWKRFVVVGDDPRLFDNMLWERCRFRYRHAWSGRRVESAFCGGLRPTRNEPQVTMRGLC